MLESKTIEMHKSSYLVSLGVAALITLVVLIGEGLNIFKLSGDLDSIFKFILGFGFSAFFTKVRSSPTTE